MNNNERKVFQTIQQMEDLQLISRLEESENNYNLVNAIKENYPCEPSSFEFEFYTDNFNKQEVNTRLSELDYDCYIKNIIKNIDGTVLIQCEIEEIN